MNTEQQHSQVNRNLTNHPPTPHVAGQMETLRTWAQQLGHTIVDICPESREKSLALTNLEQTVMWAIASLARNQEEVLRAYALSE